MNRVFFLVVWIAPVGFAGKWTEWQDATLCTGTNCRKDVENGKVIKKDGEKVQFRHCERADENDTTPCAYVKDVGPIRTIKCEAPTNESCAGWSERQNISKTCECDSYTTTGVFKQERHCNNPAPVYGDDMCQLSDGTRTLHELITDTCECETILTTPTTPTTTLVVLPCCCEIPGWNERKQEEGKDNGLLNRLRRSQDVSFSDYCYEGEECCKGVGDKSTTTADYDLY